MGSVEVPEAVDRRGDKEVAAAMTSDGRFLDWFAGFVDGEGCFIIDVTEKQECCYFQLWLRDDDRAILEEIQCRLGFGRLHTGSRDGNKAPRVGWYVSRQSDVAKLSAIFDVHPLRAKKARDFAIWRRAVRVIQAPASALRRARLVELRGQLQSVRKYDDLVDSALEMIALPTDAQLTFLADAA